VLRKGLGRLWDSKAPPSTLGLGLGPAARLGKRKAWARQGVRVRTSGLRSERQRSTEPGGSAKATDRGKTSGAGWFVKKGRSVGEPGPGVGRQWRNGVCPWLAEKGAPKAPVEIGPKVGSLGGNG